MVCNIFSINYCQLVFHGNSWLNMGIDFTGGTIIDLRFEKAVNINGVRAVLNEYDLSNSTIQLSGEIVLLQNLKM